MQSRPLWARTRDVFHRTATSVEWNASRMSAPRLVIERCPTVATIGLPICAGYRWAMNGLQMSQNEKALVSEGLIDKQALDFVGWL